MNCGDQDGGAYRYRKGRIGRRHLKVGEDMMYEYMKTGTTCISWVHCHDCLL